MFGYLRISLEYVVNVLSEYPEEKLVNIEDLNNDNDNDNYEDTIADSNYNNNLIEKMTEDL